MKRRWLTLTLRSDVALTSNSATADAASSLDFIPGACLLGAAATKLYGAEDVDPWQTFHSGALRFGPAYPLTSDSRPSLPVPLSFHFDKKSVQAPDKASPAYHNAARKTLKEEKGFQWQQLRSGFMADDGAVVELRHRSTLRTAIGQDGRAEEALLYGTDALPEGTSLVSCVEADDSIDDRLLDRVVDAIVGEIRVGRSRNTEFGRVAVARSQQPLIEQIEALWEWGDEGEHAVIFFLTDTALRDPETGSPVVWPSPEALGMPRGAFEILPERTFIRTRAWSPFNSHRRRPDLERQVVQAGSILTVCPKVGWSREVLKRPVGTCTAEGLGRLIVEPGLLQDALIQPKDLDARSDQTSSIPKGQVATWLERQGDRFGLEQKSWQRAEQWEGALRPFGPPLRAQWGAVRHEAATRPKGDELIRALFFRPDETEKRKRGADKGLVYGGVGKLKERWGKRHLGKTLAEVFDGLVQKARGDLPDPWLSRAVEILANRMVRRAKEGERG